MTPEQAIDIVASHAVATAVEDICEDGWEDYDEIGEYDWEDVCATMRTRHPFPDPAKYDEAVKVLAARCDKDAT